MREKCGSQPRSQRAGTVEGSELLGIGGGGGSGGRRPRLAPWAMPAHLGCTHSGRHIVASTS